MKSLICDYIRTNINWLEELSASPYFLKIKREGKYAIFNYSQIESDFYLPIVKEARGIIIDMERLEPVCRSFDKFHNYGEGPAAEIDWSTARVQEKVDGSIVRAWFDGQWHLSSNGMIDAHDAILAQSGISIGQIIDDLNLLDYALLDPNYTHVFELVSPYNKVVIDYGTIELYYTGRRNMITGEEERPVNIGLKMPREYRLSTLNECIAAAKALEAESINEVTHEGFVVVDANWNRIKIKNPAYVAAHHIKTKQPSFEDIFKIWEDGEEEEFLSYFPAYGDVIDFINWHYKNIQAHLNYWSQYADKDKKELAIMLNSGRQVWFISIGFKCYDLNDWSLDNYVKNYREQFVRLMKNRYKSES